MRFLFTTENRAGASTFLYSRLLSQLGGIPGVELDLYKDDYSNYDVVLFMGYDPRIDEVRAVNPGAKIGVIDPRPSSGLDFTDADFLIAHGPEMKDWYASTGLPTYIYPPYPLVGPGIRDRAADSPLIIGYHGNKVHLHEMYPRITSALEALSSRYRIELRVIYNIETLGRWTKGLPDSSNIEIKHIQWAEDSYDSHLADVDIGLMPNFMAIPDGRRVRKALGVSEKLFLEDGSDYLVRYKASSNPGRILLFAQYGIPVVADMFPSASQFIDDGQSGFLAHSSAGWYRALVSLAESPELRHSMGDRLKQKFDETAAPGVLNQGLVEFVRSLPSERTVIPANLALRDTGNLKWRWWESLNGGLIRHVQGIAGRVLRRGAR